MEQREGTYSACVFRPVMSISVSVTRAIVAIIAKLVRGF